MLSLHVELLLGHPRVGEDVTLLGPLGWNVVLFTKKTLSIAIVNLETVYVEERGFVGEFIEY